MLVKIKKSIKGYGYFGGETVSLPDEDATRFVNEGIAIVVQDTEGKDENELPEDMPARAVLLDNGFTAIEQVLAARETLIEIDGIGEKTAEKIMKVKRLNIIQSPVTLEQAKRHLRITSNDFDADISGKLEAAITAAENYTGLMLREYEFSVTGDFARQIKTGIMPIKEASVKVDGNEVCGVDWEDSTVILPDTCNGSEIEIKILTGFDVFPDDITAAILLVTGRLFENPADSVENLPKASSNLLNAYKRWGR